MTNKYYDPARVIKTLTGYRVLCLSNYFLRFIPFLSLKIFGMPEDGKGQNQQHGACCFGLKTKEGQSIIIQ